MENDFVRDEMYDAVVEESSKDIAEKLFTYIKREYHYNPSEINDDCPDFFEALGTALEGDYDIGTLIDLADEHLGNMLFERKRRIMGAM